ncbi:hypothetical protein J3R83DRAFT_3702 [Lanmaoa asiatica]|nr:hypothetical protein J3R83DRAFT_3702 [Lanmaoa asiatica]
MRALTLLVAIAMMHATHALPRQDLAVRQGGDDLSNDSHVFHHMDRNQRTANRDRNRTHGDNAEGSGLYFRQEVARRTTASRVADEGGGRGQAIHAKPRLQPGWLGRWLELRQSRIQYNAHAATTSQSGETGRSGSQ